MVDVIKEMDLVCLNWLSQNVQGSILDRFFIFLTFLGNGGLVWIVIGLALLYRKETRYVGALALLALIPAAVFGEGLLKHLIMRPRPFIEYDAFRLIIEAPSGYSFPSGHTTTSFAFAAVYYIISKEHRLIVGLIASGIALSRVYLLVHYPSDIIAGVILGIMIGILLVKIGDRVGMKKWRFFKM